MWPVIIPFINFRRLYQRRTSLPSDQSELYEADVRRIRGETIGICTLGCPGHEILREHGRLRLPTQGELFGFFEEIRILEHGENIPLLL